MTTWNRKYVALTMHGDCHILIRLVGSDYMSCYYTFLFRREVGSVLSRFLPLMITLSGQQSQSLVYIGDDDGIL